MSTAGAGVGVESLTVTAEPVDDGTLDAYQTQTATATTNADGTYTIEYLVPGTYTVSVAAPTTPSGLVTDPVDVEVAVGSAEDISGIDFEIVMSGS